MRFRKRVILLWLLSMIKNKVLIDWFFFKFKIRLISTLDIETFLFIHVYFHIWRNLGETNIFEKFMTR